LCFLDTYLRKFLQADHYFASVKLAGEASFILVRVLEQETIITAIMPVTWFMM
jgi:hypothetical protein